MNRSLVGILIIIVAVLIIAFGARYFVEPPVTPPAAVTTPSLEEPQTGTPDAEPTTEPTGQQN